MSRLHAVRSASVTPTPAAPQPGGQPSLSMTLKIEADLARLASGEAEAFRSLYDSSASRMFAIALKLLRDPVAAEDAVQEGYLRIWRNAGRYDPARGAPLAWMGVIVRNAALDLLRARRPVEELEAADTLEFATVQVEPPDARLGHCLRKLPAEQARAVTTMYSLGMSHSELAEHLSAPLGTVKSWVRRGTENLKRCMTHG